MGWYQPHNKPHRGRKECGCGRIRMGRQRSGYACERTWGRSHRNRGGSDQGYGGGDGGFDGESSKAVKYDPKYAEIARDIVANGRFSISSIQQTHEVGFNRAARIVRQLERDGIVGPQIGSKPREIKYYDLPSLEAKLQELGLF